MTEEALPIAEAPLPAVKAWPAGLRIGFRFCFVYVILYCLSNQIFSSMFPIPSVDQPDLATLWPMRAGVIWVAQHLFRVTTPLVYMGSGSGDKTFDWVLVFCLISVSCIAAAAWSVLDRKRTSYARLSNWLLLIVRVAMVSQLLAYGFAKAVPLQMPYPYLFKLLEPLRNFSPMGVLWTSVGASPAYEMFTGCAEIAGGILLIFPRTVTLGALVALADMTQVFTLNLTYDVPVKLLSFQLILLSLLLLAPNMRQLARFFFSNRQAALEGPRPLFASMRANRIAGAVLALVWLWMLGNNIYGDWSAWRQYGGGRTKSALYGVWNVEQLAIDGKSQPLDVSNKAEWRRVIFDFPTLTQVELMDDSITGFNSSLDSGKKTLALTRRGDKNVQARFSFTQPSPDKLVLEGVLDGHQEHIVLGLMDWKKFPLASRGFHWIQEYPFNH